MTDADLLNVILSDHGSNRAAMVEHIGFEPMTSSMPWKRASRLRQCPKLYLLYQNLAIFLEARGWRAVTRPPWGTVFCFTGVCFTPEVPREAYQLMLSILL